MALALAAAQDGRGAKIVARAELLLGCHEGFEALGRWPREAPHTPTRDQIEEVGRISFAEDDVPFAKEGLLLLDRGRRHVQVLLIVNLATPAFIHGRHHVRDLGRRHLLPQPLDHPGEIGGRHVALPLRIEDLKRIREQLTRLDVRVCLLNGHTVWQRWQRRRHSTVGKPLANDRLLVHRGDERSGPLLAHALVLLQVRIRAADGHLRHARPLNPRLREQHLGGHAFPGLMAQQRPNELFRLLRDGGPLLVRKRELARLDILAHLRVRAAGGIEGVLPCEKDVHDHAERPQIDLLAVSMRRKHLRRPVGPGALLLLEGVAVLLFERHREPEVADLHRHFARGPVWLRQEEVLGLEIAMADPIQVQPRDALRELAHEARGLLLGVGPLRHEPLEELAARHKLHHDYPLTLRLEEIAQSDHVLMRAHHALDGDLAPDGARVGATLRNRLDRDGLAALAVYATSHGRKVAAADYVAHLVAVLQVRTCRHGRLLLLLGRLVLGGRTRGERSVRHMALR